MAGKRLVVYYSRTGTTRKVAAALARELGADLEEIVDRKPRGGAVRCVVAAKDSALKRTTGIQEPGRDPASCDLVVVGTPVWAAAMSCAVRTYLLREKERLPKVAFFLTTVRWGADRTFRHMAEVCGKAPEATLGLRARDVKKDIYLEKVRAFVEALGAS